jgi:hypothetical protein
VSSARAPASLLRRDGPEDDLTTSLRWPRGLGAEERQRLEHWVRLRLRLLSADPMIAIIGAVGRLTEAGMTVGDATDMVLGILREEAAGTSAPG